MCWAPVCGGRLSSTVVLCGPFCSMWTLFYPIWASEALSIWGMRRHARLPWPILLFTNENLFPLLTHKVCLPTSKCYCRGWRVLACMTSWVDAVLWLVSEFKRLLLCVNMYKRNWIKTLAHFQRKPGLCLCADGWGRVGWGGLSLRGTGGRNPPSF